MLTGHNHASATALDDVVAWQICAETLKQLLANIQSGAFAEDWIEENHNGRPRFNAQRKADVEHPIEQVGRDLRRMMPFVGPKEVIPGQGGA